MSAPTSEISVTPWPQDRRWVYSISFDEALADLHRFAIPTLAEFGVPGHLEAVVSQIGQIRKIGESSFNGYRHMSGPEMREMLARGWGVGNHSWSHMQTNAETADLELGKSKDVLEEAIGEPVTIYCSSGDNSNMNEGALAACRRFGYLGAMSITDALNRPDDEDLLWMNRTFLHTQGYYPFWNEFDPFRQIQHAKRDRGWIIDYLHCPLEKAVHLNKDCSAAELRERIKTVCAAGGSDVWLARIEDATDYRYMRRAARIRRGSGNDEFSVGVEDLHPAVRRRVVTLALPTGTWGAEVDGRVTPVQSRGGKVLLDIDLGEPRTVRLRRQSVEMKR